MTHVFHRMASTPLQIPYPIPAQPTPQPPHHPHRQLIRNPHLEPLNTLRQVPNIRPACHHHRIRSAQQSLIARLPLIPAHQRQTHIRLNELHNPVRLKNHISIWPNRTPDLRNRNLVPHPRYQQRPSRTRQQIPPRIGLLASALFLPNYRPRGIPTLIARTVVMPRNFHRRPFELPQRRNHRAHQPRLPYILPAATHHHNRQTNPSHLVTASPVPTSLVPSLSFPRPLVPSSPVFY